MVDYIQSKFGYLRVQVINENKVEVISNSINKTNKVGIKDMENGVSQPSTLTIKERAQQLQVLLFGKSSFQ